MAVPFYRVLSYTDIPRPQTCISLTLSQLLACSACAHRVQGWVHEGPYSLLSVHRHIVQKQASDLPSAELCPSLDSPSHFGSDDSTYRALSELLHCPCSAPYRLCWSQIVLSVCSMRNFFNACLACSLQARILRGWMPTVQPWRIHGGARF